MIATTQTVQPYSFTPGSAPSTYNIPFGYQQTSEIYAFLAQPGMSNVVFVQGVDFSVSAASPTGGTLTRLNTWNAAYGTIVIYRTTARVNGTSVVNGGAIDAVVLEFVIDELTQMIQEGGGGGTPTATFSFIFPLTDPPGLNYTAPPLAQRVNQAFMSDALGNLVAGLPGSAPINAAWQTALAQAIPAILAATIGKESYTPTTGYTPAAGTWWS